MIVVCRTCHREERWDEERSVLLEGGKRRSSTHPVHAAWQTLKEARESGRVACGECICGQPLIGNVPLVPWTLSLPDGDYVVTDVITGPEGVVSVDDFDAAVDTAYGPRFLDGADPVGTTVHLMLMAPFLAIFMVWLGAMFVLSLFFYSFTQTPGFG